MNAATLILLLAILLFVLVHIFGGRLRDDWKSRLAGFLDGAGACAGLLLFTG